MGSVRLKKDKKMKKDMLVHLEKIIQKIGKSADSLRHDPKAFLEDGASYISSLLSPLFGNRARSINSELLRDHIKEEVKKNLTGRFHDEELVDAITDSLVDVAKADPYYSYLLDVEEHVA